jgi:hypothetical protein
MENNTDSESKWAIFTEYKQTGYISNGPYNFNKDKASELFKYYIDERENTHSLSPHIDRIVWSEDVKQMWIQQEHTGRTLFK